MILLFIYGALSIFFSFLCSILEAVLLSVTPTFINMKKKEGKAFAAVLEEQKKDVDKPLIAILTLNTIAHTVGAIAVGNEAASIYGGEAGGAHGGSLMSPVGIISAVMTILILVVSEIIPKTIGATYWQSLAGFTARTLNILIFPLKYTGILWLLQSTTKLIGKSGHGESVLSRQEFAAMAVLGSEEGALRQNESKIIHNLLHFDTIKVQDIMTPRTVMVAVQQDTSLKGFLEKYPNLRFSRIPVYGENHDQITGFILKDELLLGLAEDRHDATVGSIKKPMEIIKEDATITKAFNFLLNKQVHIALVVDEYGGTAGVVTMEDVMETLLGLEIVDESDNAEDMQSLARERWRKRAEKLGLVDVTEAPEQDS